MFKIRKILTRLFRRHVFHDEGQSSQATVIPHFIATDLLLQMHSYMAHNGMLATVYHQLQSEKKHLEVAITQYPGGREALLAEAASRQASLEAAEANQSTNVSTPIGTPGICTPSFNSGSGYEEPIAAVRRKMIMSEGTESSTGQSSAREETSIEAHRRRQHLHIDAPPRRPYATDALPSPSADLPLGTSLEPSHTTSPHVPSPPGALAWSSNEEIALLATNIDAMQEELKSNGAKGLVWPQNVTYRHFLDFMFFPTLVYQLEYPRTDT